MFSQKNKYQIFIFGEDDIIFSKKNFDYWLKYKDLCIRNHYNLGFLRTEIKRKSNLLYSTDQVNRIKYYVDLCKIKFAKLENSNCSLWIYDKDEFKNQILSKFRKHLDVYPDKRVSKIFNMRYENNNKLTPWRKISKEMDLSIQGCINIHNSALKTISKKIKLEYEINS
jgi:hypothetical protein